MLPFISKSPLIVLVVMLAWKNRGEFAGSILLNSHFAILALALAMVPLGGLMRGLTPGVSDVILLDDRQRMELLLTASQSLMAIVILARPNISWKGASALAVPFAFEWLAHGLLTPEADLAMVQGAIVVTYLLAAAALLLTDTSRMTVLTGAVVPGVRARSRRPALEHEASRPVAAVRHAAASAESELVSSVGSSPSGRAGQESEPANP
jgi:cation:H+ antiporter